MLGGVFIKEYSILKRHGDAMPFIIQSYNNIYSAKESLYIMLRGLEKRKRPYFVDNDFYKNEYPYLVNFDYFCIQVREVSEWEKFSEKTLSTKNDNILYFDNFKI